MKRKVTLTSALAAVVLAGLPLQSEAFFFAFSIDGGSWGHPYYYGWYNPYSYGYRHYSYTPYRHRVFRYTPYRHHVYRRAPYRHYVYNWTPNRQDILTSNLADAADAADLLVAK